MKVILFGASGMVGQGVLRECVLDDAVETVLCVGRRSMRQSPPKVRELVRENLYDYSDCRSMLSGFDACFFCLGVSALGLSETQYKQVNFDLTMAAAQTLSALNPTMTFIYVSGQGTDSTEKGRVMWARVKGRTENELLKLPFKAAYMFRPGIIQPLHGIRSRTGLYRFFYTISAPLLSAARALFPNQITTTEQMGRAMIHLAKSNIAKRVLNARDINSL